MRPASPVTFWRYKLVVTYLRTPLLTFLFLLPRNFHHRVLQLLLKLQVTTTGLLMLLASLS